ncbi:hypothetical protein BY996DRAFT_6421143 [Phakopsora pachyrhizi]|nr:hypothetical protein BY996DRAFT_6421143 [Phakopsora pachyrhizi]
MTWILRGSFLLGVLLIGALLAPGACSGCSTLPKFATPLEQSFNPSLVFPLKAESSGSTPYVKLKNHSVLFRHAFHCPVSIQINKDGVLQLCILTMILKEEHITSQGPPEVSKHGLINIDLSRFAPIAKVDSSLTGTERLGPKLQKSRIEKANFLLNASKTNANSQFSNYLNIPSNNTLGHLPRKPGPSLTTINTTNTNKGGSLIVTGVLSPNANQSTLSPNSIGFGKKSPQLFGRLRRNYQQQHLGTSNPSALREAVAEVPLVTGLCLLLLRLGYPKVLNNQKHGPILVDILESPTHIYKILEQIFLRKQLEIE